MAKSRKQKKQEEKKEMRSSDIWNKLQNRRSKKDDAKKIIVLDELIYLENQLSPCLNQFFFLCLPRVEKSQYLAIRDFFAVNSLRDCNFKEYFAGISFHEFE